MKTFKVLLTFESVDEIPWCDNSNETSSAVLSHGKAFLIGLGIVCPPTERKF